MARFRAAARRSIAGVESEHARSQHHTSLVLDERQTVCADTLPGGALGTAQVDRILEPGNALPDWERR